MIELFQAVPLVTWALLALLGGVGLLVVRELVLGLQELDEGDRRTRTR